MQLVLAICEILTVLLSLSSGMEALETAISYWYEVLEAYQQQSRPGGTLAIPSAEEAEFTAHLQELLDDAYRLQEQGDQLFHDEVSRANFPVAQHADLGVPRPEGLPTSPALRSPDGQAATAGLSVSRCPSWSR